MSDVYQHLSDKPYESMYMYGDTIIDHPVEKVWPHALNIGAWMSGHGLEPISGKPGQVGFFERVFSKDLGENVGKPHYHLYGIAEVIPYMMIALEVFPEKGGSYGNKMPRMSFDFILLARLGERTQVTFAMVDVALQKGDQSFQRDQQREHEEGRKRLEPYFNNLKRLVEGSHK